MVYLLVLTRFLISVFFNIIDTLFYFGLLSVRGTLSSSVLLTLLGTLCSRGVLNTLGYLISFKSPHFVPKHLISARKGM